MRRAHGDRTPTPRLVKVLPTPDVGDERDLEGTGTQPRAPAAPEERELLIELLGELRRLDGRRYRGGIDPAEFERRRSALLDQL
jgi:hypothetical protein